MSSIVDRKLLGRRRYQPLFERLHQFALRGMHYGVGADFAVTGEPQLVDRVARAGSRPFLVYDVGAHVGDYTAMVIGRVPAARVVAVEPSPASAALLRSRFSDTAAVEVVETALAETPGTAPLYAEAAGSSQSSLFERATFEGRAGASTAVAVSTLDLLAAARGDRHIDLLKLDVEGSELLVLSGARQMLEAGRIDVIQFEFGGTNLDARSSLRDFFDVLPEQYVIHRLLRDGLRRVQPWSEVWEIYTMNHYVATRSRPD